MNKKNIQKPAVEVFHFSVNDMIATSGEEPKQMQMIFSDQQADSRSTIF